MLGTERSRLIHRRLPHFVRPAVVVMDIGMPQLNGLEATRQMLRSVPGTKVLILSAHSDDAYVEQVIRGHLDGSRVRKYRDGVNTP